MNRDADGKARSVKQTSSESETRELGQRFARKLSRGDVVACWGDLGAGKTCFIKGIWEGMGGDDIVTSPTYILLNVYEGDVPLYHFDFYRINAFDEVADLGFQDIWYGDGISCIEWSERVVDALPARRWDIRFEIPDDPDSPDIRRVTIEEAMSA